MTNHNDTARGQHIAGEQSVKVFLKLETASMYGERRRANLKKDVALKLLGLFKT